VKRRRTDAARSLKASSSPRGRGGRKRRPSAIEAVPVTSAELRKLKRQLEQRMGAAARRTSASPGRWNPDPDEVQRSVAQLVLTLVEFLRQLMERQAIHRMERRTLTDQEVEAVGLALMRLEKTVRDMAKRFGLAPEDLNLDLGPAGKLL
jgi:hypothetical protein